MAVAPLRGDLVVAAEDGVVGQGRLPGLGHGGRGAWGGSEGKVLTTHKIARRGENDRRDRAKWRLLGVWDKQSKKIVSVDLQMAQFRLLFNL